MKIMAPYTLDWKSPLIIYDGVDGFGYFRISSLEFGETFFVVGHPFQQNLSWIIPIIHATKMVMGHICVSLETFHSCIKKAEQ